MQSTDVKDAQETVDDMAMWTDGLSGYQRKNGRKGIRNLVAALAAADIRWPGSLRGLAETEPDACKDAATTARKAKLIPSEAD